MTISSFASSYCTGWWLRLIVLHRKSKISYFTTLSLFRRLNSKHHGIRSMPSPCGKFAFITGLANSMKSSILLALQRMSTGISLQTNRAKLSLVSLTWSMMAIPIFLTSICGRIQSINLMKIAPGTPKSNTKKIRPVYDLIWSISSCRPFDTSYIWFCPF